MRAVGKLFKEKPKYVRGTYNKFDDKEQRIRISDGCPNNCEYCYCPPDLEYYGVPKIVRNDVKIMDMNLLCQPKATEVIATLANITVNDRVVYYELMCGIDWRVLTQELADMLYTARFKNMRFAWDYMAKDQYKIKDTVKILNKAGYKSKDIMVFMICNWKIPYKECCQKLDLLKVWNCRVSDCYFNNQTTRAIEPLMWTAEQIKDFRARCRKHNQLVTFGIDPELPKEPK